MSRYRNSGRGVGPPRVLEGRQERLPHHSDGPEKRGVQSLNAPRKEGGNNRDAPGGLHPRADDAGERVVGVVGADGDVAVIDAVGAGVAIDAPRVAEDEVAVTVAV